MLTVQVRKPDGRIIDTITVRPIRGCVMYNKDLYDIHLDGETRYIIDDYVELGDKVVPLEQSDPELAKLIAWFVQNRKEIRRVTGVAWVKFW